MHPEAVGDFDDYWVFGWNSVVGHAISIWPSRRADRAIANGNHTVRSHEVKQFRLLEVRMHLHLIHCRLNAGIAQEKLQLRDCHIGSSNMTNQAKIYQILHLSP